MLVYASKLIGTPIFSVQAGGAITNVSSAIIDPNDLKIIGLKVNAPGGILDVNSIREYSQYGIVIDSDDEIVTPDDIIKIKDILALNFELVGLKVETKKGTKLGKIIGFSFNSDDFMVQQIIVKRPTIKSFVDPELTIHRREIVEIDDYKVVVKDEEKVIKARSEKEDFVPNFVNPFREKRPGFAPADTEEKSQ